MFKWINKQGVESDDGFVVQFTGRFTVQYREGERVLTLFVEAGGLIDGMREEAIDPSAFERWDGNPSEQMISRDERARLIKNIYDAFEFQGLRLVVDDHTDIRQLSEG
jgi:hypothetical protein